MDGVDPRHHRAQARARNSTLPVIFITGHGDVPMAVSALKKGANSVAELVQLVLKSRP